MKVFKFGGASVKSAAAIRNMIEIIKSYKEDSLVIVISAMGKSTNHLENILNLAIAEKNFSKELEEFTLYHLNIINELEAQPTLKSNVEIRINELRDHLNQTKKPEYSKFYDQIVSYGELLSTTIIHDCLIQSGIISTWIDSRELIKTDNTFQDGKVDWKITCTNINKHIQESTDSKFVTQGFIGSTIAGETTTLGREGSDYTAAIYASCLNAENVTIWKDVPGILNADPKIISDATLFSELPYNEASEMTFYGAKVIHPKTIKPLANKNIPLHVRCFEAPKEKGTVIHNCKIDNMPPVIIYKENQCLISFKEKDLSFVNEKGMSRILETLHELDWNIHIMQNSAISFSACLDYNSIKMEKLIKMLKDEFTILYNTGLQLVTLKNYSVESLEKYKPKGILLLEQISRNNYRVLVEKN